MIVELNKVVLGIVCPGRDPYVHSIIELLDQLACTVFIALTNHSLTTELLHSLDTNIDSARFL